MPYRTLDLRQAAEFLHVDVEAMEQLVKKHDIPHQIQNGKAVFRRQDLHDWLSRRIIGAGDKELTEYHKQATRHRAAPDRNEAFLSQFILPEAVSTTLAARTRASLLRGLAKLACGTNLVTEEALLLKLMNEREELCSTGMPDGVAIPHTRIHSDYLFLDSFMAIAVVPGGLPFGSPDGQLTDLFFLPCTPDDRTHLYMLARLARLLQATHLAEVLRDCGNPDDLITAFHVIETEFVEVHVKQRV